MRQVLSFVMVATLLTEKIPPPLIGKISPPGDKSISHRALFFAALSEGKTEIRGLSSSEDVMSTVNNLRKLGVKVIFYENRVEVFGLGGQIYDLGPKCLDAGNSGTTFRFFMGFLARYPSLVTLIGDKSLSQRSMAPTAQALSQFGIKFTLNNRKYPPVSFTGNQCLEGRKVEVTHFSAQLKSALIFAALQSQGKTEIFGKIETRDHTERMLPLFGGKIEARPSSIIVEGNQKLSGKFIEIPGDVSSAAYWVGAAILIPGSKIVIQSVCLNPKRIGYLEVLKRMGANVEWSIEQDEWEPLGTIRCEYSPLLNGTHIDANEISSLIDELPILSLIGTQAVGGLSVDGAHALRNKETDRIKALEENFKILSVPFFSTEGSFKVAGKVNLRGGVTDSFGDHRIAMTFYIASLLSSNEIKVLNTSCIAVSYPEFFQHYRELVV